jgi:hypothetical protein
LILSARLQITERTTNVLKVVKTKTITIPFGNGRTCGCCVSKAFNAMFMLAFGFELF